MMSRIESNAGQFDMLNPELHVFFRFLDIAGTVGFAAGGAMAAMRKNLDLYGVFVVAVFTAIGGGLVRDVLIGSVPPAALMHWLYLAVVSGTTFACFLLRRKIKRIERFVVFMDALGLGFFSIVGYEAAFSRGVTWYGSLFLGVVTGTFGGMIKDVLLGEIPAVLRREIYASASMAGILVYIASNRTPLPREVDALAAVSVVFLLRMISVKRGWNLPAVTSRKEKH